MSKSQDQAQPLPQSIVLGLNAWNCNSKISNSNWETKLNEQVNINNGDSIFVKASYLDTRGSASSNIDILQDTVISLEYYFYWVHTFNACNPTDMNSFAGDKQTDLSQQVMTGRAIPVLYDVNQGDRPTDPVPAYYVNNPVVAGGATGINDADGLPYLVYQSTLNYPVPPVIGLDQDALHIVVGQIYIISKAGAVTNWEYAGVPGADGNILPAGWNFNTSYFTATHNPNIDLSPSAFLTPPYVKPYNLPYVEYIITTIGNTDWAGIDPSLVGSIIPAINMVAGEQYTIETIGTLDYTAWGAGANTVGDVFICNFDTNQPLKPFPFILTNAIFLANPSWFQPNGGPVFGADPADTFSCEIDMDTTTGVMSLLNLTGSGPWLRSFNGLPRGQWAIPNSYFGFSAATPTPGASPYVFITDIMVTVGELSVNNLHAGTTYYPSNLGVLDNSIPQFTWNMVDSTLPTTTTSNMTVGVSYQVVAPQSSVYIPDSTALVSQLFTCTNATIPGATQTYNTSSNPTIQAVCSLENEVAIQYMDYLVANYEAGVTVTQNNTGGYSYAPYSASVLGSGSHSGSPFSELPSGAPVSSNVLTLTINPNIASGNTNPITFTSTLAGGGFDEGNVYNMTSPDLYPQPQNLVAFTPADSFVATSASDSANTVATVQTYTIASATFEATGYIMGTVFASNIHVGTVVKVINPDPALPADSGGRATLKPVQHGTTTPYLYDGHVKSYVPPSTRLDIRPVKKKWKMTLKKGSYDPNNLAELISRSMSRQKVKRVNNVKGGPFGTQSTLTVPTDSIWNSLPEANFWANSAGAGANTFFDAKNPDVYGYPPNPDYNIEPDEDDMPFLFVPSMRGTPLDATTSTTTNYVWGSIPHPNSNGLNNLPASTYNINLVPLISDIKSVSPSVPTANLTEDGYYTILPFYTQNAITAGSPPTGTSGVFPVAYGATQTSLLYNNENNNLFSFNYLHTPILAFLSTTSSDLTESTAHMYSTQKVSTNMIGTNFFTTLIDKKSGILLNKMEPQSFWTQLGFDIPSLTVDLDNPDKIGFQMTYDEFNSRTTGGFSGSSNIFNPTFHTKGSADQACVPDTELIYTTVVPAPVQPITAFADNLTIGDQYTIIYAGQTDPGANYVNNWSSIGGPNEGQGTDNDLVAGMTFTATSTGFNPIVPPPPWSSGYNWKNDPLVIPVNSAVSTTTQLQNNYFQVTNTNPLNAVNIPTQRDSAGHYLIEITGYNSIYLDDKSKHEIKSIVSSYYVSANSFVSQPFPDSYNFFNYGSPLTLSNIKVRILNPFDMTEAILGPNSSVYLQINKLLTQQAVAQVEN